MLVYERARQEAKEIQRGFALSRGGLEDLKKIAEGLNARVVFAPIADGISGMIDKAADDDQAVIYINSEEGQARQRFTLAHELGHLIERQRVSNDFEYTFRDKRDPHGGYNLHEFFADEFAGELLMPDREFLERVLESNVYETASHFGVTVPAVEKRLARLMKHPPVNIRQTSAGV